MSQSSSPGPPGGAQLTTRAIFASLTRHNALDPRCSAFNSQPDRLMRKHRSCSISGSHRLHKQPSPVCSCSSRGPSKMDIRRSFSSSEIFDVRSFRRATTFAIGATSTAAAALASHGLILATCQTCQANEQDERAADVNALCVSSCHSSFQRLSSRESESFTATPALAGGGGGRHPLSGLLRTRVALRSAWVMRGTGRVVHLSSKEARDAKVAPSPPSFSQPQPDSLTIDQRLTAEAGMAWVVGRTSQNRAELLRIQVSATRYGTGDAMRLDA